MVALPNRNDEDGIETRVLLAECRGPSDSGFNLGDATRCMQLMDLVLWNRVARFKQFLANSKTLLSVVKAPGQFAGFENYPDYDNSIRSRLQSMVNVANNPRDKRKDSFADFINKAIEVARAATMKEPSGGILVAWRTAGSRSPGSNFKEFDTVLGTTFFFIS